MLIPPFFTVPPPIQSTHLALHASNPHYFMFRGKPTILVTSGEHYGAVLNTDIDIRRYLDTLHADGMNLTRLFTGTYREIPGSFSISNNVLAPLPGKYLSPWARSSTPGESDGGNKFDLSRWDPVYFRRLKDYIGLASKRGITVEVVLFCPFYNEDLWKVDPMNISNNVNSVGAMPLEEVYTLKHPEMLAIHDAFVTKIVSVLKDFDNIYYEICNEPYFGGVTLDWQEHISKTISKAESGLAPKHLIAQNISNGSEKVENRNPLVSILNFHYSNPPDSVALNWDQNCAIAFDETGFKGTGDFVYRSEGWEFMMAGGSTYSNLDYSFTAAHPDGMAEVKDPTPGGGGPSLRKQLRILKEFIESMPFIMMKPDNHLVAEVEPKSISTRALSDPEHASGVYIKGGTSAQLKLNLAKGNWRIEWINTQTGVVDKRELIEHPGGLLTIASPVYAEDIALRILER